MALAPAALAQELLRRTEKMRANRAVFDYMWQEVRDNVIPVLARFIGQDPVGVKSNQYTVDETPEQAHELLAAAVQGMIANPALEYFEYGFRNTKLEGVERVAKWLADAREATFDWMYRPTAGLAAAHHETFLDLTSFGTGCLFSSEIPGQGLLFQCRQLREIYIAENSMGRVDTVHRWFKMSARQAVQQFGEKNVGAKILEKAGSSTRQDDESEFLHAVYPRTDRAFGGLSPQDMPIASVYVSVDSKEIVRNSGFHEMPYAVPRWIKRGGEIFGRGPGTKALPSCKALQRTLKVTIRGAEKAIEPPLQVADDGVTTPVRMHSGGINMVRADLMREGRDGIRPILLGARPEIGEETMKGMRERIQASFYNHLLQMSRDPRMTATQVIQIAEETLRILGPVIGRLQAEMLGPHIERTFWVLMRAGAFPPLPPELRGLDLRRELVIRYTSPIAQAQKLAEAKGIVQTFGVLAQLEQVAPDVMDNFEVDESARALAMMFGMPRYLLRDPNKIVDIRAARKQHEQEQAELANARQAAGGIKDAAAALPALREGLGFAPDQPQAGGAALAA